MYDLSSVMFYNTKFTIRRLSPETDLLELIVGHVRDWMTLKYNKGPVKHLPHYKAKIWQRFQTGKTIFSWTRYPDNHEIVLSSDYLKTADPNGGQPRQYWACTITEKRVPKIPYAPRTWTTEIGFEQISKDEAEISCVLSYSDKSGHIGLTEEKPVPTIPIVIQRILASKLIECKCGDDIPNTTAQKVKKGEWADLWNRIRAKKRELPYIIVNPLLKETETGELDVEYKVKPYKLAYALCANALVFYPEDADSALELAKAFPRFYECSIGNIRCYTTHCNPAQNNDSYRHRYVTAEETESWGAAKVIEIFRRALVQNIDKYPDFFRIDNVKSKREEIRRAQNLQNLQEKYRKTLNEKVYHEQATDELLEEASRLEQERDSALAKLKEKSNDNRKLTAQIEAMRSDAERGRAAAKAQNARSLCKTMESLDDVLKYFENMYADRLFFTDNAKRSLKSCKLPLGELWYWLYSLAEIMYDLFNEPEAGIEKTFKAKTGIECGRGEGSQTRKNKDLMKQFFTDYKGERINTEMHLKSKDRLQSLHFGFSQNAKLLIIEHCGAHLTNASTKNVNV